MKETTLIYPRQLFSDHPALAKNRSVILVEEPLFLTEFPVHTQKLLLHRLSMQAYKEKLEDSGYTVTYLPIQELTSTELVFLLLEEMGVTHLHVADTTDSWLESRINRAAVKHDFFITRYESPLFLLTKAEAILRYKKSGKHMARFYKQLRLDRKILLADDKNPAGGKWNFDEDNRKKIPAGTELPPDITAQTSPAITAALKWLETVSAERYGEPKVWLPWTHASAKKYLQKFLEERFSKFGTYEDAIVMEHTRLFHSSLSPLINIGLLGAEEVIAQALEHGEKNDIDINNIEGFVRQILGWREFIRASYECDGSSMRNQNFWNHRRPLPSEFWQGKTNVLPVDVAIKNALRFGYNHHIERLMVLGNFMLLSETHPDEVYRWFMAMYTDAYDWVMVPNVYGMSQFADGGSFATKPYISGSNYLKKIANYPKGDWEETWTALYWNFIANHSDYFASNHRLSMMPQLLKRLSPERQATYRKLAENYLTEE